MSISSGETPSGVEDRVSKLSPERRALLERLVGREAEPVPIPARIDRSVAPLSYAQQRLWFLDELAPGGGYSGVRALRLRGALDMQALCAALDALATRHEPLRTTIALVDGEAQARIAPAAGARFPVEIVDALIEAPDARTSYTLEAARAHARLPVDLRRGPLARAVVVRFAPDDHALLLVLHHLVTDRWSTSLLERELGHFYERAAAGLAPDDLPALPVQYGDVAAWQRDRLEDGSLDADLAYWSDRLANAPAPLAPPVDRIEALRSGRAERVTLTLPAEAGLAVRGFCREAGVTPFVVLQAAFAALLHRYTGSEDVLVGTPIAGRTRSEFAAMVGLFVNTLVLRTDCSGDPAFGDLVRRVNAAALEAFEHQEIPFEKIVEVLAPARELDATPFFRVMVAVQNAPPRALAIAGLQCEEDDVAGEGAKFDLTLMIEERAENELACVFEYDDGLFDRAAVERTFGHYATLLGAGIAQPERRLSSLPLMTEAERALAVDGWNQTSRPYPGERSVHALVAEAAAASPDGIAVRHAGGWLTYRELERRANELAGRLRAAGLRRGDAAGVYVDRHPDAIVALLAVAKAGGAYVPLDVDNPPDRVRALLEDAGAMLLVTRDAMTTRLEDVAAAFSIVRTDADASPAADAFVADDSLCGDDLFYVMYTSGSTGTPKGVEIRHRGVTRLLCGTDYVDFRPTDIVAQGSNFAFDASTFEIWGALLHGATVVPCEKDLLLSPAAYARMLRDERVTIAFLTPVIFNQIARHMPDAFGGLRYLFVGGEALDPSAARMVLESGAPPLRLVNGYGPTEVTTFSTTHVVERVDATARSIPIGRPIANTTAYVVDAQLAPVPVGVPGELLLGGPGVARGYRGRPDLTAQRFIADPFSRHAYDRLYRTGDVVRRLADGALDYLGRADGQVKLRGYRVELGEIEATLAAQPDVAACAVAVQRGGGDSSSDQLVAYIVPDARGAGAPFDVEAVRARLARVLPPYMVPPAYVTLDALPMNANGKVDRSRLPAPERARSEAAGYLGPRNPIELQLVAIWEELLDRHPIGVHDDFFSVGGHSLLAVQMLHRLEQATGTRLPVRILFERPTIALLAEALVQDVVTPAQRYVALHRDGERPPFFLFHGYLDGGVYAIELARRLAGERPFYALHPHDSDGAREALPASVEAMADDYVRAIRQLAPRGPYVLGGFCNGARVAYEAALRLRAAGEEVPLLVIFTSPPPHRNRRLRTAISVVARARRIDLASEIDLYVLWNERLAALRSPKRLVAKLARRFRGGSEAAVAVSGGAVDGPVTAADERDERWYGYLDRISRYAPPRRYDGTVAVIWGRDAAGERDPLAAWRPWGRAIEVRFVPGTATSSLNEHIDDVAAALRDVLALADGPHRA